MTLVADRSPYARWLEYFEARRGEGPVAALGEPLERVPGREVLAGSIARFELGESGDGERIRRLAHATGDDAYARSIELFVREEQQHARWLKTLRERFGGRRLQSHWSDSAFVVLRHGGGLRREICVLLAAELVALSYYRVLPVACDDPLVSATCRRILADERGHVAFHRASLSRELATMPAPARCAATLAWRAFVALTAMVVAWDHRELLDLAGLSRAEFAGDVCARARRLARAVGDPMLSSEPSAAPLTTRA